MIHKVGYNSQRDNFNFAGKFSGYKQCFSTSSWMFLSFFSSIVKADDDKGLAWYLDQVEAGIGQKGTAEKVIAKMPFIPFMGSSFWWAVQIEAIKYVLEVHKGRGIKIREGHPIFVDQGSWKYFESCLDNGPVIVATHKMGGLPGGHIVLVVGSDADNFYLNDPFGDPSTRYKNPAGGCVKVEKKWFMEQCERAVSPNKVRFIGWWKSIL